MDRLINHETIAVAQPGPIAPWFEVLWANALESAPEAIEMALESIYDARAIGLYESLDVSLAVSETGPFLNTADRNQVIRCLRALSLFIINAINNINLNSAALLNKIEKWFQTNFNAHLSKCNLHMLIYSLSSFSDRWGQPASEISKVTGLPFSCNHLRE
ncbi:MAG: hypothetical protein ACKO85_19335 [Isosphaeraceae bacterium]